MITINHEDIHMKVNARLPGLALLFLAGFLFSTTGTAQETPYAETVKSRDRPELDPLGMPAGGFRLYPSVEVTENYVDNIFAENTDEADDLITILKPEVTARSNWNRHALNFRAGSSIGRYADNSDEDYEDYQLGVNGEIEIQRSSHLFLAVRYARHHIERDSPNDDNGLEPTIFDVASASAAFDYRINRVTVRLETGVEQRDYDDVNGISGEINNDDRDRDIVSGAVRLSYELYPHNSAFIRLSAAQTAYDERLDDNGVNRSSEAYQVDIGSDFRFSGILFGAFFIGALNRDFDSSSLDSIEAVSAGGVLTWVPTGLTTVNLTLYRETRETIVGTSSGILSTRAGLEVDHELLRNLLLSADARVQRDDFKGNAREDDYLGFGLAATYMMNRHLYLSLAYDYEDRESNIAGGVEDFKENRIAVTLRLQK